MPAGRGQVGQLSIRVLPDARRFRTDLKKVLERAERTLKATIRAEVELNRASLADVRREISALDATVEAELDVKGVRRDVTAMNREIKQTAAKVPVKVDDLDGAWRSRLRRQLGNAVKGVDIAIPATAEGETLRRDLETKIRRIEAELQASIPVGVEESAAWRARVEAMVKEIEGYDPELRVAAVANESSFAILRARIAALTRNRVVRVALVAGGLRAVSELRHLLSPSGVRPLADASRSLSRSIRGLDRSAPRIARVAESLALISTLSFSGLGVLTTSLDDLAKLPGILLTLPALLAGLGTVGGVLYAVWGDAGDWIGDVFAEFRKLQDLISPAFWAPAAEGMRDFTSAFIPLANDYLPRISAGLGDWFRKLAAATSSARGVESMAVFMERTAQAVENMSAGWESFGNALLDLIRAGSQYLPTLGQAFTDQMARFEQWTARITSDGSFETFVSNAVDTFRHLNRIMGATLGIIGGLASAARAAGTRGLAGVADSLTRVEQALKSPAWQTGLTTYFKGANDALARMMPGVHAFLDAFLAVAPVMAEVLRLSGDIASIGLQGIAKIATDPTFQRGLVALFEGAKAAMGSLLEVAPEVAAKIGLMLETAGIFAETLGTVFAEAIRLLAPVLEQILTALQPLIPVMGEMLVGALEVLTPLIVDLVTAIANWVRENPELAATALAVAGAVGAVVSAVFAFLGFIGPVVGAIAALVGAVGATPVLIGAAVAAIIALLAGLATAVALNWESIKTWWTEGWASMGVQGEEMMEGIKTWWNEGWASMGDQLKRAWDDFVREQGDRGAKLLLWFTELPDKIVGALGELGTKLLPAGRSIIDGFINGLEESWLGRGTKFILGIAPFIQENKGPLSYDRRLLIPAGRAIMAGLVGGLRDGMARLRSTVTGIAPMIERAMAPVDLGAKVEASMSAVKARAGDLIPSPRVSDLQVETVSHIEEERSYNADLLSGVVAPAVKDAIDGMELTLDGRRAIGALTDHRAWPKR